MATRTWNKDRATNRIDAEIGELPLKDIEIKEYVRDTDLNNLPRNVAYRLDAVHLYADILNLSDMLYVTEVEGETCHRRALRFLNLPGFDPDRPYQLNAMASRARVSRSPVLRELCERYADAPWTSHPGKALCELVPSLELFR